MREVPLSEATRIYVLGFGPANNIEDPVEVRAGSAGEAAQIWYQIQRGRGQAVTSNGPSRWVRVKATGEVVYVDRATFAQVDLVTT